MTVGPPGRRRVLVGAGLKMYLGHRQTLDWLAAVAAVARTHDGIRSGTVELVVLPTFPTLVPAVALLDALGVAVGAQDLSWADDGPLTGEVSGAELAEIGCRYAEVGHLERRAHLGETDEMVSAKTAAAFRHGLVPVVCVGEARAQDPPGAAAESIRQLHASLLDARSAGSLGPVVVAYEPHWAIGAPAPAEPGYVRTVCQALAGVVAGDPALAGSRVIYGGSAGPGLLAALGDAVDGLFVGRASHDPLALSRVLDEATRLARPA